ncbi:MAG: beta-propeller domain-containing protein [Eubacterium sp.]|nr:beta-propeller domain-containing protein [Eubacterium sp.]
MKKNDDFEFISQKFDNENITAPDSLSEDAVKEKLNTESGNIIKVKTKTPWYKTAVAIAACFAVVAVSVNVINYSKKSAPVTPEANIGGIVEYKSYDELEKAIKEAQKENETSYSYFFKNFGGIKKSMDSDAALSAESAADGASKSFNSDKSSSFATTNKQVDAVDEADIIKTDGKYIYYIGDDGRSVISIYSAEDGDTERVAEIEPEEAEKIFQFNEMYIYGDKLIAVGTRTEYRQEESETEDETADGSEVLDDGVYYNYYEGATYTFIYTYDLSDINNPKLVDKYEQSGNYVSSRMIDSCVYLISGYGRYYYYGVKESYIPCATGEDGKTDKLPINDICGIEGAKSDYYTLIGAVDLDEKKNAKETKAVLGVNNEVYCNEKNLYLTGTNYSDDTEYTRIVKYSLNKTKIKLEATGRAKGSVNDQFSMDEKDGNLRIALTDYRWGDVKKDRNYLYVLDKNLDIIGKTEGFAKNEHIEAVRFIGDAAYVITYETTDPLFIIDLSKPTEPTILGEVKIDGFSSFLTPVDENTMLGIGFCTSEEEFGIVRDGLKLALFDISDKSNPKVLDEYEIKDSGSEAQYDHKALTINKEQGYWAIPLELYNDGDGKFGEGALVIRIEDGEIKVKNYKTGDYIRRCTYIGNYLYAPEAYGETVYSFLLQ